MITILILFVVHTVVTVKINPLFVWCYFFLLLSKFYLKSLISLLYIRFESLILVVPEVGYTKPNVTLTIIK